MPAREGNCSSTKTPCLCPPPVKSFTRAPTYVQLDDDYTGYYGGYGGDFGDFGDFDDGEYGEDFGDSAVAAAAADHSDTVPVPELKEDPEANLGKAAGGNSRAVDVSERDGGGAAGAGDGAVANGSEVKEGEQEGLQKPAQEKERKSVPFKVRTGGGVLIACKQMVCLAYPRVLISDLTAVLRGVYVQRTHTRAHSPTSVARNAHGGQSIYRRWRCDWMALHVMFF